MSTVRRNRSANPADSFHMLAVTASGMGVTVQFTTVFGKRYVVERAADLTVSNWSVISTVLNGNGTPFSFTDVSAQTSSAGPYFIERESSLESGPSRNQGLPANMTKLSSSKALSSIVARR